MTLTELELLINSARELELENVEILDRYTVEQIAKIYNGIGPDRFPSWLRSTLDELHPSLRVVALIHDMEYYEGGTKEDFTDSNSRFYRNGKTAAFAAYGWYDPRRYYVWNKARQFAKICDTFGWSGWTKKMEVDNGTY